MAEHRVPMLSPTLHRHPDPEQSRDPRVRALVGQLRTLEISGPRPEFRGELRSQLVAITPRIVAEGDLPAQPRRRPSPGPAAAPVAVALPVEHGAPARRRRIRIGRPLAMITCVIAVFALLLGGAVWISQRALPGDTLYGLKRASENLQAAMTSGDTARAKLYLDYADTRYGEVSDLLPSSRGTVSDKTTSLVKSTFDVADGEIRSAMQALGSQAIRNRSGSGLGLVTAWAPAQQKSLRQILARIPAGSLHERGAASLALLDRAERRAAALKALGTCDCLARARTDDLGAVPCSKCASAAPAVVPASRTHSSPAHRAQQQHPAKSAPAASRTAGTTGSTAGGRTSSAAQSSGGASASSSAPVIPVIPGLPSGQNPLPTGSCAGLDLGLISVGRCGIGVGK